LLQQADDLFAEAEAAYDARDLTTYLRKVEQARELVQQALELLG
jgi:hypothetical protein